jgi:two-component system sensor histidine kinase HydH
VSDPGALFDRLPVGVLVVREGRCVRLNAAAAGLLRAPAEALVGQPLDALVEAVSGEVDMPLLLEGAPEQWIRTRGLSHERTILKLTRVEGSEPGEWLITLLDGEVDSGGPRLSEALVVAAAQLARCQHEPEVFEQAVETIFQRGYWVTLLRVEGDLLSVAAMREDAVMLERGSQLYGIPAEDVRFEMAKVPHLTQCFETARAIFHADAMKVIDVVHHPEVAQMIREMRPALRMVYAPIFVHGRPYGLLTVQGTQLSPASMPTLELYARLVGGAVENVRHQREAADRLHQLGALQRELVERERLAAVGQAAGLLSHEARNPLGAILNALAVLRRRAAEDGAARELIEIAEEEALRLDALVRDLLELARPLEARLRPVEVASAVDQAVAALRQRLRTPSPEIVVRLAPGLPPVQADPTLLALALDNLLRNAALAGGRAAIKVSAAKDGNRVILAVEDGGPPSGRREIEDPFDPFSLEASRGTGLGLAVVKRVADAQGATVRALLRGTRLELSIPSA